MIRLLLINLCTVSMTRNIKFTIPIRDEEPNDGEGGVTIDRTDPPPQKSYRFAGGAGIRLVFLCFLLVMVLLAMNHAAKPSSWNWLFQFEQVELPAESPPVLGDSLERTASAQSKANSSAPPKPQLVVGDLEEEFWHGVLEQLDGQQQVRLFNLVYSIKMKKDLPAGSTSEMRPVINMLTAYHQKFKEQFADQSKAWTEFEDIWSHEWLPALQSAITDRPLADLNPETSKRLPQILQSVSVSLVRDKTPVDRGREAYAWFSTWSEVFDQPLQAETQETATVTQLLAQPAAWRNKSLTIEGTALRVEQKTATFNALGIDQYYVIWVKPDHPSIYPFCVYTLVAPESLVGEGIEGVRKVDQKVATTGIFFKNRLFNASVKEQSEAAFAPVILTSMVENRETQSVTGSKGSPFPSFSMTLLSIATIATLAMMIALTIYRSTKTQLQKPPQAISLEEGFQKLQNDHRVQTTAEKLKRLSKRHDDDTDEP